LEEKENKLGESQEPTTEGNTSEKKEVRSEMSFMGHLSELRKRLMYSAIGLVVGMAISGLFIEYLVEMVLLHPAIENSLKLQNLKPFGQPILYFKLIFISGFILSIPFLIYQLWKFIAPGLYQNERKWVVWITSSATLSFLAGIAFSYFVMLPSMVSFAANFGSKTIENVIDINEYLSFYTTMMLASGLVFELPVLSFILGTIGIINSKFLRKYWRHSIIVILIVAAIITPTPDPVTQMVFAAPLIILYEISIWVVKLIEKRKKKEDKSE
jgi:sec-independent protein translocase protein TatC